MKSYKKIMDDMFASTIANTKVEDLSAGSAMKSLLEAIETDMFYGCPKHEVGVRRTLNKLGIKSAFADRASGLSFGAPLQIESLETTLNRVTFDDTKLKLWPTKSK